MRNLSECWNGNNLQSVNVDGTIFDFPEEWEVEVYDTWKFVSRLASSSLQAKACDVVAIGGDTLYLLEAKDYTFPVGTRPPKFSELTAVVANKAFHTLGGLCAGAHIDFEKQNFCSRAVSCAQIELYLNLELPADKGQLFKQPTILADVRDTLIRETKPYLRVKPKVVSSVHGGAPWSSMRDPQRRLQAVSLPGSPG